MEATNIVTPVVSNPTFAATRELRGRQIAETSTIKRVGRKFAVPSQSGITSGYIVDLVEQTCTCEDYKLRHLTCKHQEAVYYFIAWGRDVADDGRVTETVTIKRQRTKDTRDWPTYNAAQAHEREYVERLLKALCEGIAEPARKPGPGRPPLLLRDQAFASVMKVYTTFSGRRARTDIERCAERGLITPRPHRNRRGDLVQGLHYNNVFNFLADPASTDLLVSLVQESARPLAIIEQGQYALDSTGFSTVTYDRWFDQKHGKLRSKHPWVKLHLMCGTVTHAVTGVRVSPQADPPQLPELLAQTMRYFKVGELSGDKAYSTKHNFDVLETFGVEPFIAFKENNVIDPKRPAWSRALAEFVFNLDKFLVHYHRRSNAESVMWLIKSKMGAAVRSKRPVSQMNEVLAKCICHNLACVVRAIFGAGLAPKFWEGAPATAPAPLALVPADDEPVEIDPLAGVNYFFPSATITSPQPPPGLTSLPR